ncbi:hypothetical protein EH31_14735 [Erythrobacter longus]|uniref:Uncharacterized protein n=1 Tax=Erythrobacter longus TaxID=1044 RepID=A0A074M2N1_ERYLO|nr:hypothetical protein [Erythrobacter longus]KEO88696.1 hypothetical protein EH31_14735 [Erythrobacter longus]
MITRVRLGPKLGASQSWQLVLADLALILFLVTLTALVNKSSDAGKSPVRAEDTPSSHIASSHIASSHIASSQALFRSTPRGPTLAQWLAEQPADPRASLTIIAQHHGADKALMWDKAKAMAQSVEQSGVSVRVIITQGKQSELYASLAYDDPDAAQ